ncbi:MULTISPECIES: putative bifunctional diguanylate cyclase/phosphodiesterase [Citrobacter]|uniref:EAL domain-containing protein n=1 Tax=Citrobacter pasteurii TaxID=1563222 RepID=A0ABX8K1A7_9ENTR|nr:MULTISPECIES: bifunctional diguanylate cyclase/phosphodiesterase [Citrobacter]EIQ75936.1 diguanylate cyclase domain protein [Shigella flexneri 1235-66]MBA7943495.1 EAL domain-containing protein [Citrobacter sp. RHBSTW-00271]QXA42908.1 EAL domain-containing protein [Citrobacter pasteurii]TKU52661.1 EAL domain-containing protein [Citrobacter sp. wls715]CEJ64184.1 Sensory box/GGDEF family protein [Citrobacter pasteurii]
MLHVSWDPVLIGISFVVAFIASFIALDSAGKVAISSRRESTFWRLSGGATLGMGIWSMHFIGMLAMKMSMPINYHFSLTAFSFLIALISATLAINIAISGQTLSTRRLIVATSLLSTGVVTMHYVGMVAIVEHVAIRWQFSLILLSVVIAIIASGIGLWLAFHLRQNTRRALINRLIAALVMALAIASMHYTGMGAATFTHFGHTAHDGLSTLELSIWVCAVTLVILGIMLVISMVDSQLRTSRLADNLHQLNCQLEHQVHFDALTGLANRTQIDVCLQTCLRHSKLYQQHFALVFIDLDRFKIVNDTWGHHIGDQLLISSTQRIYSCLDDTMTLARLGGDEFILLVPNSNREAISVLMTRIASAVKEPFTLFGHTIRVSLSAGSSLYPEHGSTLHELKVKADTAMYHVKQAGRNGWAIYTPEMEAIADTPPTFLQELSQALERNQFELWYQPKYTAGDHSLTGFEALLRWHHPERGILLPAEFLPALEETGLIIPVGTWVLQQACGQLYQWKSQGHTEWTLAVNLSPAQFEQPDIVDIVCNALAQYQLSPAHLTLELTESTALKNLKRSVEVLNAFADLGITVSIDDFGTGYSNILMLKSLPARELKIDRIFVKDISENDKNTKIVSTIIDIAHSMNMRVVAEGIETQEQETLLTQMGCGVLQGFLYAKPLPAHKIYELIQTENATKVKPTVQPLSHRQSITL